MDVMPAARAARASSSARSNPAEPCSQSMKATSNPSEPACSTSAGDGKLGLKTSTVPPCRSFSFALFMAGRIRYRLLPGVAQLGEQGFEVPVLLLEELERVAAV